MDNPQHQLDNLFGQIRDTPQEVTYEEVTGTFMTALNARHGGGGASFFNLKNSIIMLTTLLGILVALFWNSFGFQSDENLVDKVVKPLVQKQFDQPPAVPVEPVPHEFEPAVSLTPSANSEPVFGTNPAASEATASPLVLMKGKPSPRTSQVMWVDTSRNLLQEGVLENETTPGLFDSDTGKLIIGTGDLFPEGNDPGGLFLVKPDTHAANEPVVAGTTRYRVTNETTYMEFDHIREEAERAGIKMTYSLRVKKNKIRKIQLDMQAKGPNGQLHNIRGHEGRKIDVTIGWVINDEGQVERFLLYNE